MSPRSRSSTDVWWGSGSSDFAILATTAERREAFQGTRRSDQAARSPVRWCMLLKLSRARRQKRKACYGERNGAALPRCATHHPPSRPRKVPSILRSFPRARPTLQSRGPRISRRLADVGWGLATSSDFEILGTPAERREAFQGTRRSDQAARSPVRWCMLLKLSRARRQKRKACCLLDATSSSG